MSASRKRSCITLLIMAMIGLVAIVACILFFAGHWLYADTKPEQGDAIVVLAGGPERALYAADLYLDKYAPVVLVSRPIREHGLKLLDDMQIFVPRTEEINSQILKKKGVPGSSIRIFGEGSLSTFEEAMSLKRIYENQSMRIIVITSPYHVRRAAMIFRDAFGAQHRVIVVATKYERFSRNWWTDQDSARNVILELIKILFYQFGGEFSGSNSIAIKQKT